MSKKDEAGKTAEKIAAENESVKAAAADVEETRPVEEAPQEAAEADALTKAGEQIELLQKQADQHKQQFLRAQADFDNFRRRTRLEKEELYKYASMNLIEQLLPILDNFERALSSSKETQNFEALAKGIEMVSSQLNQVLANEGLQPIDALHKPFNPDFHQAIAQVETDEHEEGTIVEEMQRGYMLKEKILRPSMVKVSK